MFPDRENRIRNIFALFNFIFLVGGITFIGLGAGVLTAYQNYDHILSGKFYSIPTFMIVCGAFAFIVGFLGCCGAFQRNFCMIIAFIILLIGLFIFEFSAGIAGYVLRDDISNILKSEMKRSIPMYVKHSIGAERFWDYVQVEYNCCGISNYEDWLTVIDDKISLPVSCCDTTGVIGDVYCRTTDEHNIRKDGCADRFGEVLEGYAGTIGAVGVIIAIIQLIGVGFAIFVARNLRRHRH